MKSDIQHDRLEAIPRYAQRQVDGRQFAGIAWCVEHQGKVVSAGTAGYRDAETHVPLTDDTLYRLYSMTKPVISVHCLQLIEAGVLQLDDPLSRWIPAFDAQQVLLEDGKLCVRHRAITIEDLLTHRSGLSYDFLADCPVASEYRAASLAADGSHSLQELSLALAGFPLACQPGDRWHYSYSTDVLASVLEKVSDKPLSDCLQDALFNPLGMTDTGFQIAAPEQHRLARMYGQRDLGEVPVSRSAIEPPFNELTTMDVDASYPVADSGFSRGGIGLYATLGDFRRFMAVLMHGKTPDGKRVLSQPMLDLSWQNRLTPEQMPIAIGDTAYPGYGWGLTGRILSQPSAAMRLSALGEGGWAGAASTYFWIDRTQQFSGIVMTQYLGSEITLGPDMQAIAYAALG